MPCCSTMPSLIKAWGLTSAKAACPDKQEQAKHTAQRNVSLRCMRVSWIRVTAPASCQRAELLGGGHGILGQHTPLFPDGQGRPTPKTPFARRPRFSYHSL